MGVIILLILVCFFCAWVFFYVLPNENEKELKEEERRRKQALEEEEEHQKNRQIWSIEYEFGIKYASIKERSTQDEIVRIVNALAYKLARECVDYDKNHRGERISCESTVGLNYLKQEWQRLKDLAIQAAPQLEKRMPHFSEFEPLKSYNAENLIK